MLRYAKNSNPKPQKREWQKPTLEVRPLTETQGEGPKQSSSDDGMMGFS